MLMNRELERITAKFFNTGTIDDGTQELRDHMAPHKGCPQYWTACNSITALHQAVLTNNPEHTRFHLEELVRFFPEFEKHLHELESND